MATLTLRELFRRYVSDGKYLPDGSLKTDAYLDHVEKTGQNLSRFLGASFDVSQLTPNRVAEYVRARRAGKITEYQVGTNCIKQELRIFKAALNWACGVHEDGRTLLDRNPIEKLKVPHEKDPQRPVIGADISDALVAVADQVHPFLPLLITLARTTGRRLSSILGLRWDDFDFTNGTIRWRAELDKRRKTWVTPIPSRALVVLQHHRSTHPSIGATAVFPHPKRKRMRGKPVTRHLAAYWLKRAYELAKVSKPHGSLWHVFRRVWATERKHLPPRDVAAAGGWSDIGTLLSVYQQPDEETMRQVVDYERPRPRRWNQSAAQRRKSGLIPL